MLTEPDASLCGLSLRGEHLSKESASSAKSLPEIVVALASIPRAQNCTAGCDDTVIGSSVAIDI